jgi:hypothetical protein
MAGELAGVREDRLVADLAVVREMHVGHHPVVVTQPRHADVERGAAIDGDVLADGVVVADLDARRLVGVLLVLRRRADGGEVPDAVAATDARMSVDDDVRADPGALAHLDVLADDRVRADFHVLGKARAAMHRRGGMDHLWSTGRIEQRIVASATVSPSTRATQANLPMPRSARSMVTSTSSWSPGTTGFLKRALSMPT